MDRFYLGIDVGSGSVKVLLVDAGGLPGAVASHAYETTHPQPGHVEQNPDDWYVSACLATRQIIEQSHVPAESVMGIGLSGTSHVPVMLDDCFKLVRPAIMFNDVRSSDQVSRLAASAGDRIVERTRNSVAPTWSLPQLAWVREREPDVFRRIRHVLFSKDYLAYRLTGQLAADCSSAASSLLVDAATLDWDPELVDLAGLRPEYLGRIHASTSLVGGLTAQAASGMGLREGVPVVIGMLDSAAELVGVGAVDPSVAVVRLGTAGGVMTLTSVPTWRNGCMLYPHAVRPLWYYQAGTNAATTSLEWALSLFGMAGAQSSYERLDEMVAGVPSGSAGMLFHPYLLGERAPYWSSHIRGGFSGVTINHGRPAFLRAVLEGVAYSLRDCASLLDWSGVTDVRLCGGGARSESWSHIIADVLGLPVRRTRLPDASALGAALAAVAGCEQRDLCRLAQVCTHDSVRVVPDASNRPAYDEGFRRYREIAAQYLQTFAGA